MCGVSAASILIPGFCEVEDPGYWLLETGGALFLKKKQMMTINIPNQVQLNNASSIKLLGLSKIS